MVSRPVHATHKRRIGAMPVGRSRQWASRRRGISLVELIATVILLGVIFTVSISTLAVVARQRRSTEQRQFALQHATNLLERSVTRGWSQLAAGTLPTEPASADVRAVLPEIEHRVDVTENSQDFDSRRVTVLVRWKSSEGRSPTSVRLSTWVYPTESQSQ